MSECKHELYNVLRDGLIMIKLDDWKSSQQENSELRAKLEAAEKTNKGLLDDYYAKDREVTKYLNKCVEIGQERDDLRRQVSEQSATIAYMRGALEWYADVANYHGGNRAEILNDGGEKASQALTASGENRYARIEEAANGILLRHKDGLPIGEFDWNKLAAVLGERG